MSVPDWSELKINRKGREILSRDALDALEKLASISIADVEKGGQDFNMFIHWDVYGRL